MKSNNISLSSIYRAFTPSVASVKLQPSAYFGAMNRRSRREALTSFGCESVSLLTNGKAGKTAALTPALSHPMGEGGDFLRLLAFMPAFLGALTLLTSSPTRFIGRWLAFTVALPAIVLGISCLALRAADPASEFSKPVIDIGMVVKDAARTAQFLTNAIGFKEVRGFQVASELGKKIGLLNGQSTFARVFLLEEGNTATRIKVLSFPDTPGKKADQSFIHATLGFRYLTLYVSDMNRALERLKAAKVPLLGETPVALGGGSELVAFQDPDGNFIELIGPRKK